MTKGNTHKPLNPHIPEELLNMLDSEYGYSLLIKGSAGTGKTTLALELLAQAEGKNKTYLSTRVSPNHIFEQFKWIPDEVQEHLAIHDATQAGTTLHNPLEDNQIALKFTGMPELLRVILSIADQSKDQHHFVIIDSWDAIQLLFEHNYKSQNPQPGKLTENLNFMYNAFMALVRERDIKLVLVAENVSQMDYLVDSIVELKRRFIPSNNKMVREIEMKKFRGIRITNPTYLFTLENGRFKCFQPWDSKILQKVMSNPTFLKLEDPVLRDLFSSIITKDIKHKIISTIIDPSHQETLSLLIENLARRQVSADEIFTLFPPDNFDIPAFRKKVLAWMKENNIDELRYWNNVNICSFNAEEKILKNEKNVINIPVPESGVFNEEEFTELLKTLKNELATMGTNQGGKRSINFGFMLPISSRLGQDVRKYPNLFLRLHNAMKDVENTLFFFSTYSNDEGLDIMYKISNMVLEINILRGVPVLNCRMPEVPNLYGIFLEDEDDKVFGLNLCPIV
ncbi:MAG: RAD55 family ATPase [Candidatus Hodarchaeota archaeon]